MALCDPSLHHCQEIVDCGFTKVVACRVGASFSRAVKTREFAQCSKRKRLPRDAASSVSDIEGFLRGGEVSLREFTLEELMEATGGFRQETQLGHGGFGTIYRGTLPDGNSVAIKVCKRHLQGRLLEQFKAELRVGNLIARAYHPNLVPVMGYHYAHLEEAMTGITVYPFMAKGDLGHYFGSTESSQTTLDWPTRKRIALSVARGIYSLHQLGVVHLDIKPNNVLLDENFNARVGDFGLARLMARSGNIYDVAGLRDDADSQCLSGVCGTLGYVSPEIYSGCRFTRKSDVYAYGLTLIQIVTNMPLVPELKGWAEKVFKEKEDLTTIMHPTMLGMYDESEALELIQLGLICAQLDPAKRPLMPEVIDIMEGSCTTLKQRWNNYDYTWPDHRGAKNNWLICTCSRVSIPWTIFTSVGGRGSRSMDDEERIRSLPEFDMNEGGPEEKGNNRNELKRESDDFSSSEDSNEEYQARATNSALIEIIGVDPNGAGSSKMSNSKDDQQHTGQYADKAGIKLKRCWIKCGSWSRSMRRQWRRCIRSRQRSCRR